MRTFLGMRIAHIGGNSIFAAQIAEAQQARGHTAKAYAAPRGFLFHPAPALEWLERELDTILELQPEVIHVHSLTSLLPQEPATDACETVLTRMRARGAHLILNAYDDRCTRELFCSTRSPGPLSKTLLGEYFSDLHIGRPHLAGLAQFVPMHQFIPMGIDYSAITAREAVEPALDDVRVSAFFSRACLQSQKTCESARRAVCATRPQLHFALYAVEDINDIDEFRATLSQSHIVVDASSRDSFSWVSLEALASGATVIAPNPPSARDVWEPFGISPVIDVSLIDSNDRSEPPQQASRRTLSARIESIVREPKSTRDLARRGRNYVERCHALSRTVEMIEQRYEILQQQII